MPSIYVESGVEEGAAYGFPPGDVVFIVGRAPNSGIVITDPLVSRQHCRIERINGRYRAVDLGSHNGTHLNDQKMHKNSTREISFGDVVRIGETELALREEAPDDEGELAGRRLGGYQLVKRIGSGGMGEVYRAVQVALGRQVAIKILSPELTEDRTFVDRFMTEARAAGKLNHPNVAQVHEVGESDGIYYYSMEYLAGGSVQERIRGGRALPFEESLKVVLGCARALEYAEKHGVIHCDIKPDNLMLTDDDEVRLTDLGIARTVKSMAEKVKQEGGVLGSPHYMAPEQARGEPIDHRVDIYALGATFYRVISGRTPFSGKNAREIMEKQVYEEPPGLRSINPEIPQSVCRVVTRMMKKKPEKRYQNARELIGDLEKLEEEFGPQPEEPVAGRRQSQTMRRGRRKKSSGAFVLLAVVALLIVAGSVIAMMGNGNGPGGSDLQLWMRRAKAEESGGDLERARNLYLKVRDLAPDRSPLKREAAAALIRIDKEMSNQQVKVSIDTDWQVLEGMSAKAEKSKKPGDFKDLAAAYGRFMKKHPDSSLTPKAKVRMAACLNRYNKAAAEAVGGFEAEAAKMAAEFKFGSLRAEWDALAARYADAPAGKVAEAKAAEAAELGPKALAAAKAAAAKALAEGKYDQVLAPLEGLAKADINQLKAAATTLISEYKDKIEAAKKKLKDEDERRKALAKCRALRDEAVKLAKLYDYVKAHGKFVEAQLAYRRAGLQAELAETKALAESFWSERVLFRRLNDYSNAGGLKSASVRLADKLMARVVSATSSELTYRRSIRDEKTIPWRQVPLETVFGLLCRPKLTVEERIVLVHFALNRGLAKDAKVQLDKVLLLDPKRKKELAPLQKVVEAALGAAPAPAPAPAPKKE